MEVREDVHPTQYLSAAADLTYWSQHMANTASGRTIPTSVSNKSSVPKDLISARECVKNALRSSSGIVGLTTQTNAADVTGALVTLASDSVVVGQAVADLVTRANLGPASGSIAGITAASTWAQLVTAIAAS